MTSAPGLRSAADHPADSAVEHVTGTEPVLGGLPSAFHLTGGKAS